MEHKRFDVLIIGAGLSGVAAAYHIEHRCPGKTYAILEARDAVGGTWDLFRYPGIRSDSDMFTLGFSFNPWKGPTAIADGASIRSYIEDTAKAFGINHHIRFGHKVRAIRWSSANASWSVDVNGPDGEQTLICRFLLTCTGYYDYAGGYTPAFPGAETFRGNLVHPQAWPENLDYAGKRVVVIGSGATAISLIPAMAKAAAHVTMLQRSPTYILSRPGRDPLAAALKGRLSAKLLSRLVRWRYILLSFAFYGVARRFPALISKLLIDGVRKQIGPCVDVGKDLTPPYNPWDQRVCVVPDGDLFGAIRSGKASVVTEGIKTFTPHGVELQSGRSLEADIIITATGLKLQLLGGATIEVDGRRISLPETFTYRGMMYSGIPNLASVFGSTNASWTLRGELICRYVCRLINHMDKRGYSRVEPRNRSDVGQGEPFIDLKSGYVVRALQILPRQGSKAPWQVQTGYLGDLVKADITPVEDGELTFA